MRITAAIFALGLVLFPRLTAAQAAEEPRTAQHFNIQGAAGSTVEGGNTQTLSFGYLLNRHLSVLVGIDRTHLPTRGEQYDRTFAWTRGGTFTVLTGALRLDVVPDGRAVPYVVVGLGRGISRPNVNDIFPERVTNGMATAFSGGGVRIPVTRNLHVFGEAVGTLAGERDSLALLVPIRAGVSWRF